MDKQDILLKNYEFDLPQDLIAFAPAIPRESARLLVYSLGDKKIIHTTFKNLFDFIPPDYLIVLNDTKVLKTRLYGQKTLKSKSKSCELEQSLEPLSYRWALEHEPRKKEIFYHKHLGLSIHLAQIRGKAREGDIFSIDSKIYVKVIKCRSDGFKEIIFFDANLRILSNLEVFSVLERHGSIPLPPYIRRKTNKNDEKNYQSIFAKNLNSTLGSVAAPTASLHFSRQMYEAMRSHFDIAYVTLHIGAGTFKLVSTGDITQHRMHSEYCEISQENTAKILSSERILCVGTSALRSVEWAYCVNTEVRASQNKKSHNAIIGQNDIFLHPLNKPRHVKALLTNFHLPKSSLIMLVSSLLGRKQTLEVYKEAIRHRYRFYSYGDCMLII